MVLVKRHLVTHTPKEDVSCIDAVAAEACPSLSRPIIPASAYN